MKLKKKSSVYANLNQMKRKFLVWFDFDVHQLLG